MGLFEIFKGLLTDIDGTLNYLVSTYQTGIYVIFFLIVFIETGLIVMPLLPGDSLLFTAGMIAATNNNESLSVYVIIPLLIVAALAGDNVNYFVGRFMSEQIKKRDRILFFKKEYITKTEEFYEKHGKQAIIIARFVPIVRTIAPFVAGASNMPYRIYILFCLLRATIWVVGVTLLGYFLGTTEIVKANFEKVILGIIAISVLPIIIGILRSKFQKKA